MVDTAAKNDDMDLLWKSEMKEKAADRFLERSRRIASNDLMSLVYGVWNSKYLV